MPCALTCQIQCISNGLYWQEWNPSPKAERHIKEWIAILGNISWNAYSYAIIIPVMQTYTCRLKRIQFAVLLT